MDGPLWTETHAPAIEDLPQETVRERLRRAREEPMNLFVHGPKGSAKTAAVRALADSVHDDVENDFIELNVADFFDRSKKEIRQDPRFKHFLQGQTAFSKQYRRGTDKQNKYKREWSKRDMLGHVLKEMAGYEPSSGEQKTILLDNAESMREDFQHSLRRVMEKHHKTTQFVIATRQPTSLIAPIRSRCFPIPVRAPDHGEMVGVLERIVDAEGVEYDREGLEYVAGYADGDIRTAILSAQTTVEAEGELTMNTAYEVLGEIEADDDVEAMLAAAEAGEFSDARSKLDDLLVDEGYSGAELMEAILRAARSRYTGPQLARVHRLAGEIDFDLVEGTNERLHLSHFLAAIPAEMR